MDSLRDQLCDEIVERMERTWDSYRREHGNNPHVLLLNPVLYDLLIKKVMNDMSRYVMPIEPMYGFSRLVTSWAHRYTGTSMRFDVDANVDVIMAMEV